MEKLSMKERISDKIIEIGNYLEELGRIIPADFEEYKADIEKKAACERYFEKIVEAVVELGFIFAKHSGFKFPEDEEAIFYVLSKEKIISKELALRLKEAKGMRNFIIHQYDKINDELVFEAVTEELEKDVKEFITSVELVIGDKGVMK